MKKSLIVCLSAVTMVCLTGCSKSKTMDDFISGKSIEIESIQMKTLENIFELRTDVYENNKNIVIYKYKLVSDPSKYIYSTSYDRRMDDTEETVFEVNEVTNGNIYPTTNECYFVKEAGVITTDTTFTLFEESNLLEIKFTSVNMSLTDEDYANYIKQREMYNEVYQKDLVCSLFEYPDANINISNTVCFYLDLNNYSSITFQKDFGESEITKTITPITRKGNVMSDYFFTYKDGEIDYLLGGKSNKLDLAKYESNNDIKYIPYEDSFELPHDIQINGKEYSQENSYCGEVLLEVSPIYNFDSSTLKYEEKNYRNLSVEEIDFNDFVSQGKTTYLIEENIHIIDPKGKYDYNVEIDSDSLIGFVNIY